MNENGRSTVNGCERRDKKRKWTPSRSRCIRNFRDFRVNPCFSVNHGRKKEHRDDYFLRNAESHSPRVPFIPVPRFSTGNRRSFPRSQCSPVPREPNKTATDEEEAKEEKEEKKGARLFFSVCTRRFQSEFRGMKKK